MQEGYRPRTPGRNDRCNCGVDRKYKKCCERLEDERRRGPQQYEHLSIKNIVLEEIRSFKEIFAVKLTDTEVKVSDSITDSDVLLFVERVRNLWDSKPDLLPHMPKKDDLKFRALYFGSPDMFTTANLLTRYALYCDQIVVIDSFSIFRGMNPRARHTPFQEPQSWVRQIVRDGIYLCSMEDWIWNDLVFATAFPLSFYDPLRKKHIEMMRIKLDGRSEEQWDALVDDTLDAQFLNQFTPDELRTMEPRAPDLKMIHRLVEDEEWWNRVSRHLPGITRGKVVETLDNMNHKKQQIEKAINQLQKEPRRYQWARSREFESQMSTFGSGMNLLDARWFADITGSHLVTDRRMIWNEILEGKTEQKDHQSEKLEQSLSALAEAFQRLEFYFLNDIPLSFALQIRKENRLVGFRTYLRDFWNKVRREDQTEEQRLATIQEFRDNLDTQYQQFKKEFDELRKNVLGKFGVAGASGAGAILSGQLALGLFSLGVLVAAYSDEAKRQTKHAEALSVFLDLERR
jgi:hypothetical protein